jgi:hypothetical protein
VLKAARREVAAMRLEPPVQAHIVALVQGFPR